MSPPANMRGIILGSIDNMANLKDLNSITMDIKIIINASMKLMDRFFTRRRFVCKARIVLPVTILLTFVGNISLEC